GDHADLLHAALAHGARRRRGAELAVGTAGDDLAGGIAGALERGAAHRVAAHDLAGIGERRDAHEAAGAGVVAARRQRLAPGAVGLARLRGEAVGRAAHRARRALALARRVVARAGPAHRGERVARFAPGARRGQPREAGGRLDARARELGLVGAGVGLVAAD